MVWPASSNTKFSSSSRTTGRQRARRGRSSSAFTCNTKSSPARTTRAISAKIERVTASSNMCSATLDRTASKLSSRNGSGLAMSATSRFTLESHLVRACSIASAEKSRAVTSRSGGARRHQHHRPDIDHEPGLFADLAGDSISRRFRASEPSSGERPQSLIGNFAPASKHRHDVDAVAEHSPRARPQPGSTVLRGRCISSGPPGRSPSGWAPSLRYLATPPGRCAPRGEEAPQAPGLHGPFPARPDDPDERLAITQNSGSRLRRAGRTPARRPRQVELRARAVAPREGTRVRP